MVRPVTAMQTPVRPWTSTGMPIRSGVAGAIPSPIQRRVSVSQAGGDGGAGAGAVAGGSSPKAARYDDSGCGRGRTSRSRSLINDQTTAVQPDRKMTPAALDARTMTTKSRSGSVEDAPWG